VAKKRATNRRQTRRLVAADVGILHSGSEENHSAQIAALMRGLAEAGHDDAVVEVLYANDSAATLTSNANTLVGRPVKVLVAAGGSRSAVAAKIATSANQIPVVFTTVADPVASGLVDSLDKSSGNLTGTSGLTSELDARRLELLKELMPDRTQVGVLTNSTRPQFADQLADLQNAAARLGLTLVQKNATNAAAIDTAFSDFDSAGIRPVLVTADALFNNRRKRVVRLARNYKIPAIYQWREFVAAGGLMSYGPIIESSYYQAGIYAGRLLDGDKIQDLPIVFPDNFELVINLKTAHQLRQVLPAFKVPGTLLARAILLRRK
jgi:putative ABC transport system substrate-binding protein